MQPFVSQVTPLGIRKRNVIVEKVEDVVRSPVINKLKRVDIFPKVKNVATVRTNVGAAVSLLTTLFILFLIFSEFIMYLQVERKDTLSVDLVKDGKILIFFNMTFPRIQCTELSVDTVDASGEQHIDLYHRVHKIPVDENGIKVSHFESTPVKLGSHLPDEQYDATQDPHSPFYCGSCYEARSYQKRCCNTCSDVMRAFQMKGLPLPRKEDIDQCIIEVSLANPGCQIYGVLDVNKVAGNFHFAPGRSFSQEQETRVHHIHEFNPYLISRFNASHTIHELSFGLRLSDVVYPLDGHVEVVPEGSALYKYFIKVVPTTVERASLFRDQVNSYQFSFTRHVQTFDPRSVIMLPGIFFVYDLSPIKITYYYSHAPFTHFLVNLCAVVGGVFVVSGYMNSLIEILFAKFRKKAD